jgi:hypothetical protein
LDLIDIQYVDIDDSRAVKGNNKERKANEQRTAVRDNKADIAITNDRLALLCRPSFVCVVIRGIGKKPIREK